MSDKKTPSKIEVAKKFVVFTGMYESEHFFETHEEAVLAAQGATYQRGDDVLIYQAIEKAVPNTKEVKVEKLT